MSNYLTKAPNKDRRCELCKYFRTGKGGLANRCDYRLGPPYYGHSSVVAKGGTCNFFTAPPTTK